MKKGDRVKWTHEYHLDSKSTALISIKGVFVEFVGRNKNNKDAYPTEAKVILDEEKKVSIVPVKELSKCP